VSIERRLRETIAREDCGGKFSSMYSNVRGAARRGQFDPRDCWPISRNVPEEGIITFDFCRMSRECRTQT